MNVELKNYIIIKHFISTITKDNYEENINDIINSYITDTCNECLTKYNSLDYKQCRKCYELFCNKCIFYGQRYKWCLNCINNNNFFLCVWCNKISDNNTTIECIECNRFIINCHYCELSYFVDDEGNIRHDAYMVLMNNKSFVCGICLNE